MDLGGEKRFRCDILRIQIILSPLKVFKPRSLPIALISHNEEPDWQYANYTILTV